MSEILALSKIYRSVDMSLEFHLETRSTIYLEPT